jgi:hypothetical protein
LASDILLPVSVKAFIAAESLKVCPSDPFAVLSPRGSPTRGSIARAHRRSRETLQENDMKKTATLVAAIALTACGGEGFDDDIELNASAQTEDEQKEGVVILEDGSCVAPISAEFDTESRSSHWYVYGSEMYDGCHGYTRYFKMVALQEGPDRRWGTFELVVRDEEGTAYNVPGRFWHEDEDNPHAGQLSGAYYNREVRIEIEGEMRYGEHFEPAAFQGHLRVEGW